MGIVVQKYGGTSLRDIFSKDYFLTHVKKCISEGNNLVIVVSAIGRKGEPYATDTLIEQLEKINCIIDPKKKDLIASCGEIISASIVAHLLDTNNIPSEALTGFQAGITTNDKFTEGEILDIDVSMIKSHIDKGKIPVIAGFQGNTKNKETTTLGRGGSDTTAVALGGYLKADRVDIFTDVPGVALIDPSVVATTQYIEKISYDDMYKLSSNGVGVIHERAVLDGKRFNIPIRIRSTYSDSLGTLITSESDSSINEILGIGLKKYLNTGLISVIFKECIKEMNGLVGFLHENKNGPYEIIWYKDKVTVMTESSKMKYYAEKIYHYYFG